MDINRVITDAMPLLNASIASGAKLDLDLMPELPRVEADQTQLRQIVMNLVLNATEAVDGGNGTIRIRTTPREISKSEEARASLYTAGIGSAQICLEVSDEGPGMEAEMARRVFEPFFTTKFTARGLGLPSMLSLVRQLGGSIVLTTAPKAGTSVAIFFPDQASGEPTRPGRRKDSPAARIGSILVVDDDPTILAVTAATLTRTGFNVVCARDGREAIDKFSQNPHAFDGVVLDLMMPEVDGSTVLVELRALRRDIPVLIMNGFAPDQVRTKLPPWDRPRLLRKPFSIEELVSEVSRLIARST